MSANDLKFNGPDGDDEDGQGPYVDLGGLPHTIPRRCTDTRWAILICVVTLCFSAFFVVAVKTGNLSHTESFEDGHGKHCTLSSQTPYLFFCFNISNASGAVGGGKANYQYDFLHPICKAKCPTNASVDKRCGGAPDYPAYPIMGMYCQPIFPGGEDALMHSEYRRAAEFTVLTRIVVQRWQPILCSMAISIASCFVEIYILQYHAKFLLRVGLLTTSFGSLASGAFLLDWFQNIGLCPSPSPYNLWGGIIVLSLGLFLTCIYVCSGDALEIASECIELSCNCIMKTPMLIFQPLLSNVIHQGLLYIGGFVVASILSTMKLHVESSRLTYDASPWQRLGILVSVAYIMLCTQILFALNQFVCAYAGILWYFREKDSLDVRRRHFFLSYWHAYRYHLGTLVIGGAVVYLSRFVRSLVTVLVSWTRVENPISRCFRHLCCACDGLFNSVNGLSKNAFIDVAMSGRGFYESAAGFQRLFEDAEDDGEVFVILNGATWILQCLGIVANAGLGACYQLWYCVAYIGDDRGVVLLMALIGALAGGVAAAPFLLMFDTITDTILFCSRIDHLRHVGSMVMKPVDAGPGMSRFCPCVFRRDAPVVESKWQDPKWQALPQLDAEIEGEAY